MKFKLILSFAIALSLVQFSAQAQENFENWKDKTPTERAETLTSWMDNNLELNETQNKQAFDVNLKYAELTEKLKTSSGSRMSKFKKLKSYDEAKDKDLKAILTPEQQKAYQDKKKELRESMKDS